MKKALLLGAGFSFDLGMPLAADISHFLIASLRLSNVNNFVDQLSLKNPYGIERPINRDALATGMDVVLEFAKSESSNYELLLYELELLADKGGISTSDRDSFHYLFGILYSVIHEYLCCSQLASYQILYHKNRIWHKKLHNLLNAAETWVFSLNHDLYFECLALDLGIPITYGESEEITFPIDNRNLTNEITLSCTPRQTLKLDSPHFLRNNHGVNLVKLHGGLSELEYQDGELICNLRLDQNSSKDFMQEYTRLRAMAFYDRGRKVAGSRIRIITNPDGSLDVINNSVLTGGNKMSDSIRLRKGEEKLRIFVDVLPTIDELTIVGYSFADRHINNKISNAMVINPSMKIRVVDPGKINIDFLKQFDYDDRIRKAYCKAAHWMEYCEDRRWNKDQMDSLEKNEALRTRVLTRTNELFRDTLDQNYI